MRQFHLYIDDSGTRRPDIKPTLLRADRIDHFALGGILVDAENVGTIIGKHREFCARWELKGPLHSTKIRGRRGAFSWLATDRVKSDEFLTDLERLLLELPYLGIACVVDRPGYMARYADAYENPWLLCKTAYAIVIERAAKYADSQNASLAIFFEEAGKIEDRDLLKYNRSLQVGGMPFDSVRSAPYRGLPPADFKRIVSGEPNRVTKAVAMIQIADMVLYPMVKGGYEPEYGPYQKLMNAGRIIDAHLSAVACVSLGVKYSCFDKKR